MGFSFRKGFKILPGVRLNLSKSGPGISVGPKGAKVNIKKDKTRVYGGKGPLRYQKQLNTKADDSKSSSIGIWGWLIFLFVLYFIFR